MKYDGIIFDLDGVICHTDQYHYQAWKRLADKLGIHFDEEENNLLRGVSRMDSLNILLKNSVREVTQEEKERYAAEKNTHYRELLKNMTEADLEPEVRRTLDKLREKGWKLAVGSSSKNAGVILERLGLKGFFDVVIDGNAISKAKPYPEVFQKAAEALGIEPGKCLVVEDAEAGLLAAERGGMDAAGIGKAASSRYAKYPLSNFREILSIVEE